MKQGNVLLYCLDKQSQEGETRKISINQKVNDYIHNNIKQIIGVRQYLRYLRNVILTPVKKDLAIICNSKQIAEIIHNKYDFYICKFVRETWSKNIILKYFYTTEDGKIEEMFFESNFNEKPTKKVIHFNEAGNKYTFDNFISSGENIAALEVSQSIACYSQKDLILDGSVVFIYGSASCGKTHLINAIGNFYRENGGKAVNITGNDFLRRYTMAVRENNVFNFQDNLLDNDIIIIDDIDDLIGKNGTLIELKKLLNIAIENEKYIVLAASETQKQLSSKSVVLNEILSSATSWKLDEPKEALKTQIAMNYINEENLNVPITIVKDLVLELNCNIRELKKYIKKLAIAQSIHKFELNTNLALEILSDDIKSVEENKRISNEEILSIVSDYYCLSINDLKSKNKHSKICKARNIAMYLMRKINISNYQEIGKIFNRSHSTVILSINIVNELLQKDKKVPAELADIMAKIKTK